MEGWTRKEAQQRAAWNRSGASEWEVVQGGAAQPSADDDDYLKAARQARSKRMGTLSIPVPDEDFDGPFDFESAAGGTNEQDEPQLQRSEAAIPLPTVASRVEDAAVGTDDATQDALPVPQWYPSREPADHSGEDTLPMPQWYPPREPVGHSAEDRSGAHRTGDSVRARGWGRRGGMQQQHNPRQTLDHARTGYSYGWREGEQIAPEPEPEVEHAESRPSFADE
jgi:hypothetical protein